jgi:drug/metabolite transporter (DMT)-like permease
MSRFSTGLALAILAALMWAIAIILSKITLETIPSNTVFMVQLIAATGVAGIVLLLSRDRLGWSREHLLAYSTGLFEPFLAYTLSLYGLSLVSASIVSVIFATESIMILFLSLLLLGTVIKKPASVMKLVLIAFLGVILVMAPDLRATKSPSVTGYLAVSAGVFFAALYVVISSKLVLRIAPIALLTGQLLTCCLLPAVSRDPASDNRFFPAGTRDYSHGCHRRNAAILFNIPLLSDFHEDDTGPYRRDDVVFGSGLQHHSGLAGPWRKADSDPAFWMPCHSRRYCHPQPPAGI